MMNGRWHKTALAALSLSLLLAAAPAADAAEFRDVPETYWAAEDIQLCVEQGFFTGQDNGLFGVGAPMERGAFMAVLARFFHWNKISTDILPYEDVTSADWFAGSVAAAYHNGAITRQSERFRPYEPITREELAVTLVRALGYQSIAGLAEAVPYSDVTRNTGYIAMAYDLGLMNGNQGKFLPENAATREQTAVVLARLYRRLHSNPPARIGLISEDGDLNGQYGLTAVGVRAGRLTGANPNSVRYSLESDQLSALRAKAAQSGMALLHISGSTLTKDAPALLASETKSSGFDGLFLQLSNQPDPDLIYLLKARLGAMPLYLAIPAGQSSSANYAALLDGVDMLILCVEGESKIVNGFPLAPVEPVEEIYAAVRALKAAGGMDKVSLMLTTSGTVWTGAQPTGTLSGQEIETLVKETRGTSQNHYSDRYACAYLHIPEEGTRQEQVVWYLDAQSLTERSTLLRLLGIETLCLSDVGGMTASLWSALS